MDDHIFREYDIRGIVNKEFTIEETYALAQAILTYFLEQNRNISTITIGMDGRIHSPHIKKHLIDAITKQGINVLDIGICPTPVMYFSLFNLTCDAGLMITASHNPKEYNGIKICLGKKVVWGKEIQKIKKIYQKKSFFNCQSHTRGMVTSHDMISEYVSWLSNHFAHLHRSNIAAVIDCGNGAGGTVMPQLIKEMQWQHVSLIHGDVDGTFPNHIADPTVPENMYCVAQALQSDSSLALGFGLDGDCDRMTPMTRDGKLVPGDILLAVYSKKIIENNPGASIVFDIKSSEGLIEILKQWGAKGHISPSGHSIIKANMLKHNALLAGELSCHFFFNDRYFGFDDGIYALLRLMEILHETGQDLRELLTIFPQKMSSPEIRITCNEDKKTEIIEAVKHFFAQKNTQQLITIDGVRAHMDYGWGLVRASNTQPKICLRFESDTKEGLQKITADFKQALLPNFEETLLDTALKMQK